MTRFAPRLLALFSASALAGCTMMGGEPALKETLGVNEKPPSIKNIASDLDGNVRQAQLLRLAGKHDEAIRILSQLTLIAADDARVVGEYGKALAQIGRAQDATQFLRRAVELAPNDWTLYSALGVAYDQVGDQLNARAAYERALSIRPGEASVLNNYALSRMLAKDPETARTLIAQARAAGAPGDEKITRNVALINQMAPPPVVAAAPMPAAHVASNALRAAPPVVPPLAPIVETPVAANEAPRDVSQPDAGPRDASDVARRLASQSPVAEGAPRTLIPVEQFLAAPPEVNQAAPLPPPPQAVRGRVVMQAVPFDPLAGPVKPRAAAKPKAVAAKKTTPVKQAEVPSLRVANEQY